MSLIRRPDGLPQAGEGAPSSQSEIDAFIQSARQVAPSPGSKGRRIVFALDATASRGPTWALAREVQASLFEAAAEVGGIAIQLAYYRGFDECRASQWVADPAALRDLMLGIGVRGGRTQIERILTHVGNEARRAPVSALVFVGDAVEEPLDELCAAAGELGMLGVKAFMLHEGGGPASAFGEIARLTGGAALRFEPGAADTLRSLLRAVGTYAAGGRPALVRLAAREPEARRLIAAIVP